MIKQAWKRLRPIERVAVVVSVLLLALIVIKIAELRQSRLFNGITEVPRVNPLDITFGADTAKVTIFAYMSYHCGYCRLFFTDVFPELEREFIGTGRVKLVIKLVEHSRNPDRLREVKTAVCINRYGYYGKLHELLVTNSSVIYTDEFREMVDHFIDSDPHVAECILGDEATNYILQIRNEFDKFGFTGTPTFIIEGKVYRGFMPFYSFKSLIMNHLKN